MTSVFNQISWWNTNLLLSVVSISGEEIPTSRLHKCSEGGHHIDLSNFGGLVFWLGSL